MFRRIQPRRPFPAGLSSFEGVVVLFAVLVLSGVVFYGVRTVKRDADRAACIENIRNVQLAVRAWQASENLDPGVPLNFRHQFVRHGNAFGDMPRCPTHGTYSFTSTIPPVGTPVVKCSLCESHGHAAKSTEGW